MELNVFFFQAEDGIRDLVRSRGLGDVYKRQLYDRVAINRGDADRIYKALDPADRSKPILLVLSSCLLYTSDAADERSSVDLGGRRIIKKKTMQSARSSDCQYHKTCNAENDMTRHQTEMTGNGCISEL